MSPLPNPGDPEQLTGPSTYYWSRVFPTVWSSIVGVLVLVLWLGVAGDAPAPGAVKWVATGMWAGLSTMFFRMFGGLRHVWIAGDDLLVGEDPRRGVRIPLREVREVRESRFQQVKTVTLELGRSTPAGRSVRFIPKGMKTFVLPYASSPVAEELRERHRRLLAAGAQEHRIPT